MQLTKFCKSGKRGNNKNVFLAHPGKFKATGLLSVALF